MTAVVHEPDPVDGPGVLLVPGAGGNLDGGGLVALAEVMASHGCLVVRCNLPHNEAGRPPPRADRSVDTLIALLKAVRDLSVPGQPWVLGGKSYGARVSSMSVAAGADAVGTVSYGYPLHPPGQPHRLRVEHWDSIGVPMLFLQGSRDPFCDLELLAANLPRLAGPATVEVAEGGDHSLEVPARHSPDGVRRTAAEILRERRGAIDRWLRSIKLV